jgi:Spy/CpxP family protein refolding chaperone
MRSLAQLTVLCSLTALVTSPAYCQPPEGGRGGRGGGGMRGGMPSYMLLGQESVQKELKFTDEQKQQVDQLVSKMREEMQGLQDAEPAEREQKMREMSEKGDKAVKKILQPEQAKRLREITLQVQGPMALANPKVADELQLTDDQKAKIKDIQEDMSKEVRALREGGAGRQEMQRKTTELRKQAGDKIQGLLSADQKSKWKEMTGEPFKGEIRRGGMGGGQRERGGNRP